MKTIEVRRRCDVKFHVKAQRKSVYSSEIVANYSFSSLVESVIIVKSFRKYGQVSDLSGQEWSDIIAECMFSRNFSDGA